MRGGRDDYYAKRARAEGKPARSVFKLEEIDKRWGVFAVGQRVLDLGAAPGSWTQYAAQKVGPKGLVIAVDLSAITIKLPSHVTTYVADAFALAPDIEGHGPFDVVVSDMAPKTMGDHKTDAVRSFLLCEAALSAALRVGRPGGHVVLKALEGQDMPALVKAMRTSYKKLERLRPLATRRASTEIFLIGLHKL